MEHINWKEALSEVKVKVLFYVQLTAKLLEIEKK